MKIYLNSLGQIPLYDANQMFLKIFVSINQAPEKQPEAKEAS
jgi:hypothetical protein